MRPMYGKDKNCQSKPISDMSSVTKSSIMWLPKPAMGQSNPDDKNCQSTRCYKKKNQVKSVCDEKNCQST